MIYAVIYDTKQNFCLCSELGPRTESKEYPIQIPRGWKREDLALYNFVGSKKTKRNSPSIYLTLE